ncbi:hypothetical protein B0H14DRAFT_3171035 [Mycena olivaceomarginata]|nr:hypothetical protein B0H14DRAFT_3171035 [Mycena olivaceomarginata]
MPRQSNSTDIRMNSLTASLEAVMPLLTVLNDAFGPPFIQVISNTIRSLFIGVQNVKKNKDDSVQLVENIPQIIYAIVNLHLTSSVPGSLPPATLYHLGRFTETLHKIYAFVEMQQDGNKIKHFFRQSEISKLLKCCQEGLQDAQKAFKITSATTVLLNIKELQKTADNMHNKLLELISTLSDESSDGGSSSLRSFMAGTLNSKRLSYYFASHFQGSQFLEQEGWVKQALQGQPCITQILVSRLKPAKDLTKPIVEYFNAKPACLLILDNLETPWEPLEPRSGVEGFLSLITDVPHLALITFLEITDNVDKTEDIHQILSFTNNIPLAVDLVAHLVDIEGSTNIELLQIKLPLQDVLTCKAVLLSTSLAYIDGMKRLKCLVPIREYMEAFHPAPKLLIQPLERHFSMLLNLYKLYGGSIQMTETMDKIALNLGNLHQVLSRALVTEAPDLKDTIQCIIWLNSFSRSTGRGWNILMDYLSSHVLHDNHTLGVKFIVEILKSVGHRIIDDPEQLASQARAHFQGEFYLGWGYYSALHATNISGGMQSLKKALVLAESVQDMKLQASTLICLAYVKATVGEYREAWTLAREAQRLSKLCGNLFEEARALQIAAHCAESFGNYNQAIFLLKTIKKCLSPCNLADGIIEDLAMNTEAGVHLSKSEYAGAKYIHLQLAQKVAVQQSPVAYAFAFLNIGQIDVICGAHTDAVSQSVDRARALFGSVQHIAGQVYCEAVIADLKLRDRDFPTAKAIFEKCLDWSWTCDRYATRSNNKLALHKALSFFGDIFLADEDESTAKSLFFVALEGFTHMGVHHSRANCMLRLVDIAQKQGDRALAIGFWTTARPLFERSLQTQDIFHIDSRLATIQEQVQPKVESHVS